MQTSDENYIEVTYGDGSTQRIFTSANYRSPVYPLWGMRRFIDKYEETQLHLRRSIVSYIPILRRLFL